MLTSGTIIAIVILAICTLVLIAGIIAAFVDGELAAILIVCSIVVAFITQIGFMVVGYNSDYLTYKPVTGKVDKIASRQISDGKGMSQRFVFQIAGQPYGVDDTRAALVKEGDTVNLNCTKQFVWGSTNNGYACNWG